MKKLFVNILCGFIPSKTMRHSLRRYFGDAAQVEYRMLLGAVADPNGRGMLEAKMFHANVPEQHRWAFYKLREGDVCLDCGANTGLISDIMLRMGATCYAFEPEPDAIHLLNAKFAGNPRFNLIPHAVSDKDGAAVFHTYDPASEGANMRENVAESKDDIKVKTIRLTDFIRKILAKHGSIAMLKIDIEGTEYRVLEDIIKTGVYARIKWIFVETHERMFKELTPADEKIRTLIKEQNIGNIYLDWV